MKPFICNATIAGDFHSHRSNGSFYWEGIHKDTEAKETTRKGIYKDNEAKETTKEGIYKDTQAKETGIQRLCTCTGLKLLPL